MCKKKDTFFLCKEMTDDIKDMLEKVIEKKKARVWVNDVLSGFESKPGRKRRTTKSSEKKPHRRRTTKSNKAKTRETAKRNLLSLLKAQQYENYGNQKMADKIFKRLSDYY